MTLTQAGISEAGMRARFWLAASLAGLGLAGCSVSEPLSVQSTTAPGHAPLTQIALAMPAEDEPGTNRQAFAAALENAFAARGIATDDSAKLVADFALSESSAALGVQLAQDAETRLERGPDWVDAPRKSGRFDKCDARELRGSLVLVDRSSGEVVYRGRGQATECGFDEAAMRALADLLVAEFLAEN